MRVLAHTRRLYAICAMHCMEVFRDDRTGRQFRPAAGALHRSQPAISRRIELIEQECGVALIDRLRGGARLTDAGEALLPYAEAILAAAKDGADAVRAVKQGEQGVISLALVGTL